MKTLEEVLWSNDDSVDPSIEDDGDCDTNRMQVNCIMICCKHVCCNTPCGCALVGACIP